MLNTVAVIEAAIIPATGSAKNTARTLFSKKSGNIKAKGTKSIIFFNNESIRETLASPKATNVC